MLIFLMKDRQLYKVSPRELAKVNRSELGHMQTNEGIDTLLNMQWAIKPYNSRWMIQNSLCNLYLAPSGKDNHAGVRLIKQPHEWEIVDMNENHLLITSFSPLCPNNNQSY
jgi:hypothetical protein